MNDLKNALRPLNSAMMVGQTSTVKVLHEMRKRGHIDHAMLFWGYSGCGKTTSARIMASFLNCENPVDGEPCNECSNCKALRAGNFSDYYELDAASNSGKEDIEKLLEGVSYAPLVGKNKVYVIDECHRLSSSAWDALLKVIEEPPKHVYFMLCTTELEKVPKTIQTRAKAYSFTRISEEDIFSYLSNLNTELNKGYTEGALRLLSEISDGSMREAVNNFEHVSTPFSNGEEITEDSVRRYLAIIGPETVLEFVLNVAKGDIVHSYNILEEQEKNGVNAEAFIKTVHNSLSDCLSAKFGNRDGSSAAYAEALKGVESISLERLVCLADNFNECYSNLSERNYASLKVRVAKLCIIEPNESSISSLKAEIGRLKSQLKGINVSANSNAEEHPTHDILMADDEPLEESTNTYPAESNDFVQDNCYSDSEEDAYYSHMAATEYDYEYSADITDLAEMEQDMQTVTEEPETEEQSEEDIVSLEDMLSIEFQHIQQEEEKKAAENPFLSNPDETDNEDIPFESAMTIGDYTGGIIFNSASAAGVFKASQHKTNQLKAKIMEIRKTDPLFDVLISDCSVTVVNEEQLVIKTPFESVKRIVDAYITRYELNDTVCHYLENMKFEI